MTGSIRARVAELGYVMPRPRQPDAPFLLAKRSGSLLFVSGQVPQFEGERRFVGKVGADLTVEQGVAAAELCALNVITWVAHHLDDRLDRFRECVRVGGFVACTPDFTEHSRVIGGASRLIVAVFGEAGRHARTAVGVPSLPFGCTVEIEGVFEIAA